MLCRKLDSTGSFGLSSLFHVTNVAEVRANCCLLFTCTFLRTGQHVNGEEPCVNQEVIEHFGGVSKTANVLIGFPNRQVCRWAVKIIPQLARFVIEDELQKASLSTMPAFIKGYRFSCESNYKRKINMVEPNLKKPLKRCAKHIRGRKQWLVHWE